MIAVHEADVLLGCRCGVVMDEIRCFPCVGGVVVVTDSAVRGG